MPDNEKFMEGVKKERIEQRIAHYNEILHSGMYTKESEEYIKAADVIEEIVSLLEKSKPEYSFVEFSDIVRRIDEYLKSLEYLDRDYLTNKKEQLEGELDKSSSSYDAQATAKTPEELLAELERVSSMKVRQPTQEELDEWKRKRAMQKDSKILQGELAEIDKAIQDLDSRDPEDVERQKRVTKNRIDELQDISTERELFRINEKGEVVIDYPDIVPELDEEAIMAEYAMRRADMVDKFYGNRQMAKRYAKVIKKFEEQVEFKDFEYVDENGNKQVGVYRTIASYPGMEEDLEFAQLEELVERLERLSKYEAGDKSVYEDIYVRDEEGKIVKLSPEEAREADQEYIGSNNHAYNTLVYTTENLRTLGKYGERVPYSKFQEGEPVRNILRAVGNAGKFVRNNVTAPINRLIGKAVSPAYALLTGAKDDRVAGLYANKRTHRYVARREYYQSQGQGFFKSRFNSIFHAKEANQAILNAGAYDIQESLRRKYVEIGQREAMRKKTEFAAKSIAEKIKMIETDMETATSEADKAKFKATLEDLRKAEHQISIDRGLNESAGITQTRQTDAVSEATHDVANKENVTRTITGVKFATRLGFRKLIGPKIEDWLLRHTTKTEQVVIPPTEEEIRQALNVQDQRWVPSTYKTVETDVFETRPAGTSSVSELMSSNTARQVEGYYSVYGGERRPALYDLTGNEKITAIFKSTGRGGTGLSDTAGLRAPTLVDGTFPQELLDANGVLRQDVSLDTIINAVGASKDDLSGIYVSVGDRYWAKLSDLYKGVTERVNDTGSILTEQVKVGTDISQVIDIEGHYEALTSEELALAIDKALQAKLQTNPNFLSELSHTVTQVGENSRVVDVLRKLDIPVNAALIADDVYENTRRTYPDPEAIISGDRHYETKTSFTGKRKEDLMGAGSKEKKQDSKEEQER